MRFKEVSKRCLRGSEQEENKWLMRVQGGEWKLKLNLEGSFDWQTLRGGQFNSIQFRPRALCVHVDGPPPCAGLCVREKVGQIQTRCAVSKEVLTQFQAYQSRAGQGLLCLRVAEQP